MKSIIKLCVVFALVSCGPKKEAAEAKAVYDTEMCVVAHQGEPVSKIIFECGEGELTDGDVTNILFSAHKYGVHREDVYAPMNDAGAE